MIKEVATLGGFRVVKAVSGPLRTNNYLIMGASEEALLIDAGPSSFRELKEVLRGIKLNAVLLTHGHFDHVSEASLFRKAFDASIYLHVKDAGILKISERVAGDFGVEWLDPEVTDWFREPTTALRNVLKGLDITVIHTPGHTPGSVIYSLPQLRVAFTGDTIFKGALGATHFPGGDEGAMAESLTKVVKLLPKETVLFPGHGRVTKLEDELRLIEGFVKRVLGGKTTSET